MGLDRRIVFPGEVPTWDAIRLQLAKFQIDAQLRMIDGLPAFPDESPESTWKELRIGFPAGMVTLRRAAASFSCVVWGNAEGDLRVSWDRLCWACAEAGEGSVESPTGLISADEFALAMGLFPS